MNNPPLLSRIKERYKANLDEATQLQHERLQLIDEALEEVLPPLILEGVGNSFEFTVHSNRVSDLVKGYLLEKLSNEDVARLRKYGGMGWMELQLKSAMEIFCATHQLKLTYPPQASYIFCFSGWADKE